ncbi:hypothetical protein D3C73_857240 [compost metagenome]
MVVVAAAGDSEDGDEGDDDDKGEVAGEEDAGATGAAAGSPFGFGKSSKYVVMAFTSLSGNSARPWMTGAIGPAATPWLGE